jgi:transposase
MRQVREVLRLKWECNFSDRKTARSCGISRPTVAEYVKRAEAAGLSWPLPPQWDDCALEARLFPSAAVYVDPRPLPDYAAIHRELAHKGVTLMLLWEEHKSAHPTGLQYSQFCERYRTYARTLDLSMRQVHRAGEKCFIDYAGQTVPVIDPATGEARAAQIFVAVLGASNYTYCEATWTQQLPDWIGSHGRAFEYFQCVPELLIPDNLRSAVTRAHRYEPLVNETYAEMAAHYGTAILPARVRRPRDKAKVEAGVLLVERWILARLRHQSFFSLAELNDAIAVLRERLNTRAFRKLPGSRRSLFETLDRPAMKPLPTERYVFAEWKRARVHVDYHIEIQGHYYSVPYQRVGQQLEVRVTGTTIEAFHRGARIASHVRSSAKGRHTTLGEHMPRAHREYAEWTPTRLVAWAEQTGPVTAKLIAHIMAARAHPQQGFRSCLGIMRLGKSYGRSRLEAACARALALGASSYRSIESILRQGLEQQPLPARNDSTPTIAHPNVRGRDYYQ